jgi:hypothetical protein
VRIELEPAVETVTAGDLVTYTVTAFDQYDNPWDVTAESAYSIDAGAMGSWTDNVYSSAKMGTWTVTATYEGLTDTASLTVNPDTDNPQYVELTPDPETVIAGQSVAYTLTAFDPFDNPFDVTAMASYSIEAGAMGSWVDNVYTSAKKGDWTVTGSYEGLDDTALLTVEPDRENPVDVDIDPDEATLIAGQTQAYTLTGYDAYDNDFDATADSTFSIEPAAEGFWTDNVYSSAKMGVWTPTGTYLGLSDTAVLTVLADCDNTVRLDMEPDEATVMAGYTQVYTATAYDRFDNPCDVTDEAIFETGDPCGTFEVLTSNNVYMACRVGRWVQQVTWNDMHADVNVNVVHGDAAWLSITPQNATVKSGETRAYMATAYDMFDNPWTVTAEAVFSTSDPLGAFVDNVYTGGQVGEWEQTATYDSVVGTTNVHVIPGDIVRIELMPDGETVEACTEQAYTVTAYDSANNPWDVTTECTFATTDPMGAFVDNMYTGGQIGDWVQTATYDGLDDTADVTVVAGTEVDSLEFGPIGEQIVKVGFSVTITAYDCAGNVANFDGEVVLTTNISGTDTIEPDVLSCVDGVCTGEVAVMEWQDDVVLTATAEGVSADSDPFDVKPLQIFLPFIVREYVVEPVR